VASPASARNVQIGGTALQIVAGFDHTCALLQDHDVRCWGAPHRGQLGNVSSDVYVGDDEPASSAVLVSVAAKGEQVKEVAAGEGNTCVVLSSGALRCWGDGSYGQLGHASENDVGED